MSEFITDEVKEAAAMALAYWDDGHDWNDLTEGNKNIYRRDVFHIIHAAIPLLEKAIRADERKKCELACLGESLGEAPDNDPDQAYNQAVNDCAAAIRARGE